MKRFVFILLFASLFGIFSTTSAQFNLLPETEVGIELIPENPEPNKKVTISVVSYATDLNSANITWKINGKTEKVGTGEKSISFITGNINTTTTVEITIKTISGETIEKKLNIKPTTVDLIWESESFTPPFYKGKALFSHQNKITVIALPQITSNNGAEISAKNLIYKWKKNGTVVENASGFGKNTYAFVSPIISRPISIEVDVTTATGSATAYAFLNLSPSEPLIVFYKKDPIYGIQFQKQLQNEVKMERSREFVVVGFPLFFGTTKASSEDLTYTWSINGTPINNEPRSFSQIFRKTDNSSGVSSIELSVENGSKILQSASNNFRLIFENNND